MEAATKHTYTNDTHTHTQYDVKTENQIAII